MVDHAPALGGEALKVAEEGPSRHRPLMQADLRQRLAVEGPPFRGEQIGPRRTVPVREVGVGHLVSRLPAIEHAGEALAGIAVRIDEDRLREDGVQERHPQRVSRGGIEKS